jgi:hypothetical protein
MFVFKENELDLSFIVIDCRSGNGWVFTKRFLAIVIKVGYLKKYSQDNNNLAHEKKLFRYPQNGE